MIWKNKMRYLICLIALVCGLNQSSAYADNEKKTVILIPGTNYCGPGNIGGKPQSQLDAACKEHDESKGYSAQNPTNYIPGLGNKKVQEADKRLILDSAKVVASKDTGKKEKVSAAVVGSYFAAKNRLDKAGEKARSTVRSAKSNIQKKYTGIKSTVKKIFRRKKR